MDITPAYGKKKWVSLFFYAHAMYKFKVPSMSQSLPSQAPKNGNTQTDRQTWPNQYAPQLISWEYKKYQ